MPIICVREIIDWKLIFLDYKFLGKVNENDLKKLNYSDIAELCNEIRAKLITTVSKNGGHLASNLGVVELTVALHRFLNLPKDSLIFDVGHQCYTHKIITGRRDLFSTLRQHDGIAGFPKPCESVDDALEAKELMIDGEPRRVIDSKIHFCIAVIHIKRGYARIRFNGGVLYCNACSCGVLM